MIPRLLFCLLLVYFVLFSALPIAASEEDPAFVVDLSAMQYGDVEITDTHFSTGGPNLLVSSCVLSSLKIVANRTSVLANGGVPSSSSSSPWRLTVRDCVVSYLQVDKAIEIDVIFENITAQYMRSDGQTVVIGATLTVRKSHFSASAVEARGVGSAGPNAPRGLFLTLFCVNCTVGIFDNHFSDCCTPEKRLDHQQRCIWLVVDRSQLWSRVLVNRNLMNTTYSRIVMRLAVTNAEPIIALDDNDDKKMPGLALEFQHNTVFVGKYFHNGVSRSPVILDAESHPNKWLRSVECVGNSVTVQYVNAPFQGVPSAPMRVLHVTVRSERECVVRVIHNAVSLEYENFIETVKRSEIGMNAAHFYVAAVGVYMLGGSAGTVWPLVEVSHNDVSGRLWNAGPLIFLETISLVGHLFVDRIEMNSNNFSGVVVGPTVNAYLMGVFAANERTLGVGTFLVENNMMTPQFTWQDADVSITARSGEKDYGGPGARDATGFLLEYPDLGTFAGGMFCCGSEEFIIRNNTLLLEAYSSCMGFALQARRSEGPRRVVIEGNYVQCKVFTAADVPGVDASRTDAFTESELLVPLRIQMEYVAEVATIVANNTVLGLAMAKLFQNKFYTAAVVVYARGTVDSYSVNGSSISILNNTLEMQSDPTRTEIQTPNGQLSIVFLPLQAAMKNLCSITCRHNTARIVGPRVAPRYTVQFFTIMINDVQLMRQIEVADNTVDIDASVSGNVRVMSITTWYFSSFSTPPAGESMSIRQFTDLAQLDVAYLPPFFEPSDPPTQQEGARMFQLSQQTKLRIWIEARKTAVLRFHGAAYFLVARNDIRVTIPVGSGWLGFAMNGGDFVREEEEGGGEQQGEQKKPPRTADSPTIRFHDNNFTVSTAASIFDPQTSAPDPTTSANYFFAFARLHVTSPLPQKQGAIVINIYITTRNGAGHWRAGAIEIRGGNYIVADSGVTVAAGVAVAFNDTDDDAADVATSAPTAVTTLRIDGARFEILRGGRTEPPPASPEVTNGPFTFLRWASRVKNVELIDSSVLIEEGSAAATQRCHLTIVDNSITNLTVRGSTLDFRCKGGMQLTTSSRDLADNEIQPLFARGGGGGGGGDTESQQQQAAAAAARGRCSLRQIVIENSTVVLSGPSSTPLVQPLVPFCAADTANSAPAAESGLEFTSVNILLPKNDLPLLRMVGPVSSSATLSAAAPTAVTVRCFSLNNVVQWKERSYFASTSSGSDEAGQKVRLNFVNPHKDLTADGEYRCHRPALPWSRTASMTKSISIVPPCSSFTFVVGGPKLRTDRLAADRRVWVTMYLVAGSQRDRPFASSSSKNRIVPPTPVPAGQAQSEAVTVFTEESVRRRLLGGEGNERVGGDGKKTQHQQQQPLLRLVSTGGVDIRIRDAAVTPPRTLRIQLEVGPSFQSRSPFDLYLKLSLSTLACNSNSSSSNAADGEEPFLIRFESPEDSGRVLSTSALASLRDTTSRLVFAAAVLGGSTGVMRLARARAMADFDSCEFNDEAPSSPLENIFGLGFGQRRGYWIRGSMVGFVFIIIFFVMTYSVLGILGVYLEHRKNENEKQQRAEPEAAAAAAAEAVTSPADSARAAKRNSRAEKAKRGGDRNHRWFPWLTRRKFLDSLFGFGMPSKLLLPGVLILQPAVSGSVVFLYDRDGVFSAADKFGGLLFLVLVLGCTLAYLAHVLLVQKPRNHWVCFVDSPPPNQAQPNPAAPLLSSCPQCSASMGNDEERERKEKQLRRRIRELKARGEELPQREIRRKSHVLVRMMNLVLSLRDFHCYWKMRRPPEITSPAAFAALGLETQEQIEEYKRQRRRNPDKMLLAHSEEVFVNFKARMPSYWTMEFSIAAATAIVSGLHPSPLSSGCDYAKAFLLVLNVFPFLVTVTVQPFNRWLDFTFSLLMNGLVFFLSFFQALSVVFPNAEFVLFGVSLIEITMEFISAGKTFYDIGDFLVNFMPVLLMLGALSRHLVLHRLAVSLCGGMLAKGGQEASMKRKATATATTAAAAATAAARVVTAGRDGGDDGMGENDVDDDLLDLTRRHTALLRPVEQMYRRHGAPRAWNSESLETKSSPLLFVQ